MSYEIRGLLQEDREWVASELGPHTLEVDMGRPELVDTKQLERLYDLSKDRGTGYVVERSGKRAGVVGGVQHGHIFNPSIQCFTVLFWFVDPAYRKTRTAHLLLKEIRGYCQAHKLEFSMALQPYSLTSDRSLINSGLTKGEVIYREGKYNGD